MRRIEDFRGFAARTRVVPLKHRLTGLPIDVGLEEEFLGRARILDVNDLRVPFISPEDLLVSKILAGRDKDRSDVRGILRAGEKLDLTLVRRTRDAPITRCRNHSAPIEGSASGQVITAR